MPESFEIGSLDVNSIKSVTVIKKPEVAAGYGRKDADGVIEITTVKAPQVKVDVAEYGSESMKKAVEQMERAAEQMEQAAEQMEQAASKMKIAGDTLTLVTGGFENMSVVSTGTSGVKSNLDLNAVLIVVDGKVMEKGFEINSISPTDIASVTVFKGAQATGKYGDAAKNGVIEISLRKASAPSQAGSPGGDGKSRSRQHAEIQRRRRGGVPHVGADTHTLSPAGPRTKNRRYGRSGVHGGQKRQGQGRQNTEIPRQTALRRDHEGNESGAAWKPDAMPTAKRSMSNWYSRSSSYFRRPKSRKRMKMREKSWPRSCRADRTLSTK